MTSPVSVIVAVDNDQARETIARQAAVVGYAVRATHSGNRLFELFRTYIPDILVLSLRLERSDAIQVIHRLRKFSLHTVVVLAVEGPDGMAEVVRQIAIANGFPVSSLILGEVGGEVGDDQVAPLLEAACKDIPAKPKRQFDSVMMQFADAMRNDELFLNYQPLVGMVDRRVVGVEALVRWNHPTRGELVPDRFIPLAEQSGLIVPMTWWVLQRALRQYRDWRRQSLVLPIAVNISAGFLTSIELPDVVLGLLADYECPPEHLTLEITETDVVGNPALALEVLARLRLAGVKVAMDDYGVGFSDLRQLRRYPFSDLKIDRWMVEKVDTDHQQRLEIERLVEFAGVHHLRVTGEGVETPEQWATLQTLGCNIAQGYLIARPLPALAVSSWIDAEADCGRFGRPLATAA
jgi:EAL domain-containing protein (putative c-di-GMP-specific phosphodiesterase class I)